eukprot:3791119-Alexandrium_andersonii.AAC.1
MAALPKCLSLHSLPPLASASEDRMWCGEPEPAPCHGGLQELLGKAPSREWLSARLLGHILRGATPIGEGVAMGRIDGPGPSQEVDVYTD